MLIKTVAICDHISRDNDESEGVILNYRSINTRVCDSTRYQYKLHKEIEPREKLEA